MTETKIKTWCNGVSILIILFNLSLMASDSVWFRELKRDIELLTLPTIEQMETTCYSHINESFADGSFTFFAVSRRECVARSSKGKTISFWFDKDRNAWY